MILDLPRNIQYKILSFCSDDVLTSMVNVSNSTRTLISAYNEFIYS